MAQHHDILDEIEDTEEPMLPHRQRSFRFILYIIGIALLLIGRMYWSRNSVSLEDDFIDAIQVRRLFALGVAGIWLFSGLGSLASIRAFKLGERSLLFVLVTISHLLSLVWSTAVLVSFLIRWGGFDY